MTGKFDIAWHDAGREPQCAPNPLFPNGLDMDVSQGALPACVTDLPYPAKRCGHYVIVCRDCGLRVGVTTAGRPDDPKSVKMACKVKAPTVFLESVLRH